MRLVSKLVILAIILLTGHASANMLLLGKAVPKNTLAAPVIISPLTATATVGVPFSYQIVATSSQTSFSATGLPAGLTVNTTTGVISGIPTTAGQTNITLGATNAAGTGNATLVLTVTATPVISSALTASGTAGSAFTYTITATNTPTSYNATGLPAGLTVSTSTGVISGTPAAPGISSITISASNAGGVGSATLVLTIGGVPSITSTLTAAGTVSTAFSYQITATNTPTSYNATGLPAGLSVSTSTGAITGTPSANGVSSVTISATNASGTGTAVLTITISAAPVISSALTASGVAGTAFSYTITATNTPTSFNASGLPAGLSVSTSTGAITGTPTVVGTSSVTISATNATGTGSATLVLTINAAPVISSALTAGGTVGSVFSYTITASNTPTSFSASGLPSGLSVNTGTGVISGTPTGSGGSSVTLGATNATGTGNATLALTISEAAAPSITSALNSSGTIGTPFSYQITGTNTPTSFGAAGLPSGLSINATTGLISGTPGTPAGTASVTLSATNAIGTGTAILTLRVDPAPAAPVITSPLTASGQIGSPFSYSITATNTPTSYNATGLPAGLSVSTSTGMISGTPAVVGIVSVTLSATNLTGTGNATLSLTITSQPTMLWTPSEQPATQLWWQARDASTVALATGVTGWTDKRSGVVAAQVTGSRQPVYSATSFNSRPGITFSAPAFQRLLTPAQNAPQQWTVFSAVKSAASTSSQAVLYADTNSGAGTRKGDYSRILNTGAGSQPIAYDTASTVFTATTQTIGVGVPVLLTTVRDATTIKTSVNGGTLASVTTTGTPASGSIAFSIGSTSNSDVSGPASFFNGTIAEVIFVQGALDLAEIQRFEGYIAWGNGLEGSLPFGHPWKDEPPYVIAAPASPALPQTTGSFLDTLGVGGQISAGLQDRLIYTGLRIFRVGSVSPADMTTLVGIHNGTAVPGIHPGVKFTYQTDATTAHLTDTIANRISRARTLASSGALKSLEGLADPGNSVVNWGGVIGGGNGNWAPVAKFTRDFYAAVKSDPVLAGYPVLGASKAGVQATYNPSANYGLQFLSVKGGRADQALLTANGLVDADYSDYVAGQNYVDNGSAPVANMAWNASSADVHVTGWDDLPFNNGGDLLGLGKQTGYSPAELIDIPKTTTATGLTTFGRTQSVTQSVQGKILLNVYLSQARRGRFAQTLVNELVDNEGSPGVGFGLYSNATTPKLAATYIHNLTTILADPGYAIPEPLSYSVTGPATTHDLLLKHSDGRRFLIVWNERIPDAGGTDSVTVDLGQAFQTVNVYDPVIGTTVQSTQTNVQNINLTMADKPVILELNAAASGAPVLLMASDAVKPGQSINVTGDFIDDNASLDVAIERDTTGSFKAAPPASATHPTIIQRDSQGHFLVATMPVGEVAGVYNLWAKNAAGGWSLPYKLNAPRVQFISDYEAFDGIDIEVAGRNFDQAEFGGVTATVVRLNNGQGSVYVMPTKDLNPYHVTFTVGPQPLGNYFVEVSNDNGLNWSRPSSGQTLSVIKKTGTTPIGLGVSWEQDFAWGNEINITASPYNVNPAKTACTGNDTSAFYNAGLALANAGGGVMYLPNGNYSIFASELDTGVVWKGQSQAGVKICYLDASNRAMIYSKQATAVGGFPERQGLYNLTLTLSNPAVRPDQFIMIGDNLGDMHMQFRKACRLFVKNVTIDYDYTTGTTTGPGRGIAVIPAGKERFVLRDNNFKGYYAQNPLGYFNQYMIIKNNVYEYKNGGVGALTKYAFVTGNTILVHPPATQPEDESHGLFTRGESYIASNTITGAGASNSHSRGEGITWEVLPGTAEGAYNYGTVVSSTKSVVTVAPHAALTAPQLWSGDLSLWITAGRGMGQLRKVALVSGGNTITLNTPLAVAPDSTSKWTLVSPNNNITVYNNTLVDDIVGVLGFGASYDTVVANNIMTNTDGVSYWAINQEGNNDIPSYYNRVVRNTLTGIARAARSTHIGMFTARITGTFYDTIVYATEFVENSITADAAVNPQNLTVGSMHSGFALQSSTDPTGGVRDVVNTIIEKNALHNMDFGVTLMKTNTGVVVKDNTYDILVGQFLLNSASPWGTATNLLSTGNVLQTAGLCTDSYAVSGPVTASANNQVIENLKITAAGPAINTNGKTGVQIRNVLIHHTGNNPGILVTGGSGVNISRAEIINDSAPASGANATDTQNNIFCINSSGLTVNNVKVTKGSTGIYLEGCPSSNLSFIEGYEARGPFPRGQLVQWSFDSNNGSLSDFYSKNDLSTSWTEDNVNVYRSHDITIARGVVDGNNSPFGVGVIVDEASYNIAVTDVDALNQGNGCFSVWGGGQHDVTFTNARCRDNHCEHPRGHPASNSLGFATQETTTGNIHFINASYFNLCNPGNVAYNVAFMATAQFNLVNFTTRAPISAVTCQ